MREALEVVKEDGLLLGVRKVINKRFNFPLDGPFSRIHGRIHFRVRESHRTFPPGPLDLTRQKSSRGIERNAIEPGPERKFDPVACQAPQHPKERFLGCFLGLVRVAKEP